MGSVKPKRRTRNKRGHRIMRALLVVLLFVCLAGAGYLAFLGVTELVESKEGSDYYALLAASVEAEETQQTAGMTAPKTEVPVLSATKTPAPTVQPTSTAAPVVAPETITQLPDVPVETWIPPVTLRPIAEQTTPKPTHFVNQSEIDFAALQQTCPDVVGWIRLEDSAIDYPVVHGKDNDFYLRHLPDGTVNRSGSVMMDQSNTGSFREAVNILHGHHMRSGSMFGRLVDYRKEEYFQTHPIIRLYTPAGDFDVAVFAAYSVNGYNFGYPTFFEDEAAFNKFIRRAFSATPYETGVEVHFGDRVLMLSTCAYSYIGERYIVLGKIIEPEESMQ